jgi:hypothetical protein
MQSLLDHPYLLGVLTALFLAFAIEAGRHTAARSLIQEDPHRREQMVALRDGLFVLMSLLMGFTLALAAARYAERRTLLIDEANAIGVTYLRAETLTTSNSSEFQLLLRQYVDARLEADNAGLDSSRAADSNHRAMEIQKRLWEGIVEITKTDRSAVAAAYLSSLNQVIDLYEKRIASLESRVPISVWLLIFSVSVIAVFTGGLTLARRFWLTVLVAPLTIAITITLIADLDTPSSGFIRMDQRAMLRLRDEINDQPK